MVNKDKDEIKELRKKCREFNKKEIMLASGKFF